MDILIILACIPFAIAGLAIVALVLWLAFVGICMVIGAPFMLVWCKIEDSMESKQEDLTNYVSPVIPSNIKESSLSKLANAVMSFAIEKGFL